MKKTVSILLLCVSCFIARADHITGGEMYYTVRGGANNIYTYDVTLKLFMRCNSGRQFPDPAIMSVFDKLSNSRREDISVPMSDRRTIQISNYDPCISNPPEVCYEVAYYSFSVTLPGSVSGYVLSSQVNFRIRGISNLDGSQVGATYTCEIPGTSPVNSGPSNNSAVFTGSDLVIVCAGNYFSYSFAAADADASDNTRYSFCAAYASSNDGTNGVPAGEPPYYPVPYSGGYSESAPLGLNVKVDPATGLITGIAPPGGVYVVTVCAEEIRNGTVIATQRKDVQINVADCSIAAAQLENDYMLCGTTRSITVNNIATSPLIITHDWQVFNPVGTSIFTSTTTALNYTFPAINGIYTIRLIVNRGRDCSDTTTAPVYVFPGLAPGFDAAGICITRPTVFTDRTTLISGSINSWTWDFGEPGAVTDVSSIQHPVYTYPAPGLKNIRLIVTTTDGCRDTVYKTTDIIEKPPIRLAFRDTLICINDVLQLQASGTGNFAWSPPVNMINAASSSPTVSPPVTTTYYVDLETEGCRNRDSVLVRVVDHVSLQLMNDTTICRGDTIQLRIISDGLQYSWQPALQVLTPALQNPLVITQDNTPYQVTATIGGCSRSGVIAVRTVPYPLANAGSDTIICYNTSAQLHGVTDGNSWQWTPASTLSNTLALDPVANPVAALTGYIFTAYDIRGCPKPGRDTMLVTMLPKIRAFAGRDTAVVINQPLQLNASGGDSYLWSPSFPLSAVNIANPVAVFNEPSNGLRYQVQVYNIAGCFETAAINIMVYATLPTVFVPTAFTPNNDGKNEILRPIAVGMKHIEYFSIFNRWGQLVFNTTANGHGWDGRIGGQIQANNTYVWMVKAVDFNGKPYFKKGTVTLIR